MDTVVSSLIGTAWVGIAAILAWSLFRAAQRVRDQDGEAPFFRMLSRTGVTLTQAEEAVGIAQLSSAVRRCVLCASNETCRARRSSHAEPGCPNATVFERVQR